ncbi:hypothetical protein SRHO_G00294080 [Serrasalmus rhombeus]
MIAKCQNTAEVNGPPASGEDTHKLSDITVLDEKKEVWLLYDDSLYYIWEAEGNCTEAAKFCRAKGSNFRLAVLTQRNRDWLTTQAKGRRLLLAEDDSSSRCKLVGDPVRLETPFIQGEEQGWVCEQHNRLGDQLGHLDYVGHLDKLDSLDNLGHLDKLDFLDNLDNLGHMVPLENLDILDKLDDLG